MNPDHPFDDYRGRRVLIMGLGTFGGGMGAARFMLERGASVTITDLRPEEKLVEPLAELHELPPCRLVLGGHNKDDFRSAELVVANPAVKRDCPYLNAAIQASVPVTSEMNLFWKWNPAKVIAITGSNGKSTTTAMTHAIISRVVGQSPGRRGWLGGNIGASLLPLVDQIKPDDLVVLELSSFQLCDLDRLQVSPHVAVVTNFTPNHLDWHSDLDHYRHSKQAILRWQTAGDFAVLNDDDPDVCRWPVNGTRFGFGLEDDHPARPGAFACGDDIILRWCSSQTRWPQRNWLKVPGRHNIANALAAMAASVAVGADPEQMRAALTNYQPLPHRLQFVGEFAGRRFFNDSVATTPESTVVALAAFESPIVLLAGGYDKQVDLSGMAQAIAQRAKAVALMGQTAAMLRQLIEHCDANNCEASAPQSSLAESFEWAFSRSAPGDVIVLSPGCASYDWFRNFTDRGQQFTALVLRKIESAVDNRVR